MSRRVLIVVSSYAPAMIADMHRARHLSWTLPMQGWEVEILAPDNNFQKQFCLDADSSEFFPVEIPVHYVTPCWKALFDNLKLGNIGWRALYPLWVKGKELLRSGRFDLVFLSTTQFQLFLLGRLWQRTLAVPYVLDFHDPCYREVHAPIWAKPSIKHWVARHLSRWIERVSTERAAGIIAVSPNYIETLKKRYKRRKPLWMVPGHHQAIPFSVFEGDFEIARLRLTPSTYRERLVSDNYSIIYVGAGGPIMHRAFELLCKVLARLQAHSPELLKGVVIKMAGTEFGWRDGNSCYLANVALATGVLDCVHEVPRRVTYGESLKRLLEADGALILGVEDDGYMPSKLFGYAWSGKPLLAVLRRKSPGFKLFEENPEMGHSLWFDESVSMPESEAIAVVKDYLRAVKSRRICERRAFLGPYRAMEMARRHVELFELCLTDGIC